jgi:pimeloyl-ACP methyl ester carboxylesterase
MRIRSARQISRIVGLTIVPTMLLAACTADSTSTADAGYAPKFAATECPGSVIASATRETRCGYLTVPEDRSNPSGRQIRLFVVRYEPNEPTTAAPVVYAGGDIGSLFDYSPITSMADHLNGPEVIGLEPRGTGFSQPNLSCPEVDGISPRTLATPIADPAMRLAFVEAVKACYLRFSGQGIDLSAYNVEEAGADLLDLVQALGLKEWAIITKGSTSRIVFSAMRTEPAGLRALVMYDPEFPDTDTFAQAIEGTRAAVSELETLCEADGGCARRFPDLQATFGAAIRRFDEHPRTVRVQGKNVQVDGARLLRDMRTLFASVAADTHMYLHLPATIDALAFAKDPTSSIAAVVSPELSAPTFCTGYMPGCGPMSQGAYYSALCADIAPFADLAALTSLAGEGSAWRQDYVDGPYRDVCDAWKVTPAAASVTAEIRSDVPVLVFSNGLDPTVTPDIVRSGIAGMPNAFVVVTPVWGHAPSIIPACPEAQPRNAFLADPTSAPDAQCQERFQPTFASSPL